MDKQQPKRALKQSTMTTVLNGGSILLILLTLLLSLLTVSMNHQVDLANKTRFELTSNANRFMNASSYLTNEVRAYSATGDEIHFDNYWNEIDNLKNRDIAVENLHQLGITPEEAAKIETMSSLSSELVPLESAAMDLVKEGRLDAALHEVYGDAYEEEVVKINAEKATFLAMIDERANSEVNALLEKTNTLQTLSIIAIGMIVVFQIISLLVVRFKIIKPIIAIKNEMICFSEGKLHSGFALKADSSEIGLLIHAIHDSKTELSGYIDELNRLMSEMAAGNFDVELNKTFIGDFENIQTSVERFIADISSTLSQINRASQQLSTGSVQVSASAQSLAQGATEQASTIQQLSASLVEVSNKIVENTENSQKAAQMSTNASGAVQQCNKKMEELLVAIREINDRSEEIGKIIKTIDDIAFQTNILALNAAVEAARAGAAGKGFAVVADEVRNLASKSAEAAKNTASLIEKTIEAVDSGTALAKDTAAGLLEIVGGARETTSLVSEVTEISKNQAVAISQINTGVDQITQVVTTNSAASEQSAAASEELQGLANQLQGLVNGFKTRQGGNALHPAARSQLLGAGHGVQEYAPVF